MARRIAIISEHASPLAAAGGIDSGGQNIYVAHVGRQLARLGYEVDVFTRRDSGTLPEVAVMADNLRVIHVPAGPAKYVRKEELLPAMDAFSVYLIDWCRRYGSYDLVHANFFMSGHVAVTLRAALGIPFVITFHALGRVRRLHQREADQFPPARLDIEDRIIRQADAIIAECPQDKTDMVSLYHADPRRIRIIPCGFDRAEFWPIPARLARRMLGYGMDEPVLLCLGRMVPRKGIDNVIRGVARLQRDHGIEARLVVVGGNSDLPDPALTPEIARLKQLAQEEGVAERVSFTGRRSRELLKIYYSAADAFVTTPWYEPFGITPLEAMACGTPVIGSDVGGIKYSVADGETGMLVPPRDPATLAGTLAQLFGDPETLRQMSRKAIRRVNAHFTWEKVARAVAGLYEDVCEAQHGATRPLLAAAG